MPLDDKIKRLKQWVVWKKDPKKGKVPYQINGVPAKSNDSDTWTDYFIVHTAIQTTKRFNGVGIMLDTQHKVYTIIDLDHCFNENGTIKDYAQEIVLRFDSYTEYSVSGQGLHIIIEGVKPGIRCRTSEPFDIEMYDQARFVAITENMYHNKPIENRQEELNKLYNEIFPPEKEKEYRPTVDIYLDDADLMAIIQKDRTVQRLWKRPTDADNWSQKDLSLCNKLAFYCGRDADKMDRFFRMSPLMRDKWERKDYRQRTINTAILSCEEVYTPPSKECNYIIDDLSEVYDNLGQEQKNRLKVLGESFLNHTCLFNEDFLSDIFCEINKDDVIWSTKREEWFVWSDINWQLTNSDDIKSLVTSVTDYLLSLVEEMVQDTKAKNRFLKDITTIGNNAKSKAIVEMAKPKMKYEGDFDYLPEFINCLSGIVNLRNGELLDHNRSFYMSTTIKCVYDLKEPQKFTKFLMSCINNDQEMFNYIRRMAGYCLTGETTEQTAYFLYGTGQTGKSTLLNIFSEILGGYAENSRASIFTDTGRFELANLYGKRLVCTSELTQKRDLASETFKAITGGDTMACEMKNKQKFLNVKFQCKVLVATNELPRFNAEYAIKRRLKFIPFDRVVESPDPWLPKRLLEEKDQIFAWMVQGAIDYFQQGVGELESMKDVKEETIIESNDVYLWFEGAYNITNNPADFVSTQSLWAEWTKYCYAENVTNPYRTVNMFIKSIKQQYNLLPGRDMRKRGLLGLTKITFL